MKTAIQEVFSDLEKLHPNLFNMHTTEGKEFVNHFHKYLEIEKEQIIDSYSFGYTNGFDDANFLIPERIDDSEQYYKETYKNTDK